MLTNLGDSVTGLENVSHQDQRDLPLHQIQYLLDSPSTTSAVTYTTMQRQQEVTLSVSIQ